ncbi:P27 family phage terminase small subunit [Rhizobium sp. 2YAF20]
MADTYKIPPHLRSETRKWARGILADFDLESHHFRQLVKTCEAWDRSEQAREMLLEDGLTVVDRYGTKKAHPCVGIERDARTAFFRGLRELALDVPGPDSPRAPRTADYGNQR